MKRSFVLVLFLCGCAGAPSSVSQGSLAFQPALTAHGTRWYNAPKNSGPWSIVSGPDGALWFTELLASRIGRITTSGVQKSYPTRTANAAPLYITVGPDKALWFTECAGGRIGRMSTSGRVTEFKVPNVPTGIAKGPDGALWFLALNGTKNYVGRLSTSGKVAEYLIPHSKNSATLNSIVAGPDGALWFAQEQANLVGRITTSGRISLFHVSSGFAEPSGIGVVNGQIWVGESNGVASVSSKGTFTQFSIPFGGGVLAITEGPQNSVWFGENTGGSLGTVAGGKVLLYPIHTNSLSVSGITYGRDHALWFVDRSQGRIGKFLP
ncbi:MAG: Virginiamycin B lyase [Candidatus Eremiobacteraeota bacterium]|nr:Virginiamycin B lyase [Candidatus Eremiobacteraeota bacterium]